MLVINGSVTGYLELGLVSDDVEVGLVLAEKQCFAGPSVGLWRLFPCQTCPHIGVVGT